MSKLTANAWSMPTAIAEHVPASSIARTLQFLRRPDVHEDTLRFFRRRLWYEFLHRFLTGRLDADRVIRFDRDLLMSVRLGDPVDRSVYLYGSYEYRVVSLFIQLIQPGMTVVDGGSYHGLYTLLAAKRVGVAGRVLAIEPHPASWQRLEANVARNHFENVVVFRGALAATKGEAALFAPADNRWLGESSLRPDRQWRRAHSSISVVTERLDALLELVGGRRLDVLKLDVEGLEAQALRGGQAAITKDYPAIILEVNDLEMAGGRMSAPALDQLRDWGYRIHGISINRSGNCSLEELPSGGDPRPYREPWLALNVVGLHPASRGSGAMIR